MYRVNRLKDRLAAGRQSLGLWIELPSTVTTELAAQAGYDFALIDNEHGPGTLEQTQLQLQVLAGHACTSVVRAPWNDAVYLKRLLDIGAESVMIPMIETAEQAKAAVAACRYPPRGFRGSGFAIARAADYGVAADEYMRTAHERLLIILQIESERAVANVDAIAAVDGVDLLYIGPNDLSGSIGRLCEWEHPEVAALLARARDSIRRAGKPAGIVPHGRLGTAELFRQGYAVVTASSDLGLMRDGMRAELDAMRPLIG